MVRLATVGTTFHARVIAARLGAEGIVTDLRGNVDGIYPMGDVHVFVPEEDLAEAQELVTTEAGHGREETRTYLLIWVRRFTYWGIFGYALPEAAWWLGIPGALYALLLKTVGLVLAVLATASFIAALDVWITNVGSAGRAYVNEVTAS